MSTINPTLTIQNDGVMVCTWASITENDTGRGAQMARFPDRTVQAIGDFTTSGAISMEGSNDGTNWGALHDPTGAAIVLTALTQIALIVENPLYVRPRASAGTAVSMTVIVVGAPR